MLVPLVDMLNHAGDYVTSPPGAAQQAQQAFDNVRWGTPCGSGGGVFLGVQGCGGCGSL
jgi:hypothetical protein